MNSVTPYVVVIMLVCWTIAGYLIWKWGPGLRKRTVQCPEKNLRARILAEQVEGDFNCLRVVDVKGCSLIAGDMLTCARGCLRQL
jgi:hypothetical protein